MPFQKTGVRKLLILLFHIGAIVFSFVDAFALRFDLRIPAEYWSVIVTLLPIVVLIKLPVFWLMGLAEGWWRYVSMPDLLQIFKANIAASVALVLYVVFFHHDRCAGRDPHTARAVRAQLQRL